MPWWRTVLRSVYGLLFRERIERRIDAEFRFHLEMRTQENVAAGMSEEEARKDALRRFGNQTYLAETAREIGGGLALDTLRQDLRYGARMLVKHPGFTAVAVVTLALGIGANTAIFSVVHAVLLRPLPYENPEQLMVVWSRLRNIDASRAPASGVQLRELRDRSSLFQDIAGIWVGNGTLTGDGEAEQVKVANVTANSLSLLGVRPALGRSFLPEEEGPGPRAGTAVILSHGLWVRRFGGDPDIVGRAVRLEGYTLTVVGVMPPDFQFLFSPDADVPVDIHVWIPFPYDISEGPRDLYFLRLFGRLKPGVTADQAQGEADSIAKQLCDEFGEYGRQSLEFEVVPLHGEVVGGARSALVALWVGAGLVLLISCANVANLSLMRVAARGREMAVRAALGASRLRIIRQLLCESLLLGGAGGALGLVVGWWALKVLLSIQPGNLPRIRSMELDFAMLAFVTGVSIGAGLLCGLAPVLETRRVSLISALKGAGQSGVGPRTQRMRSLLIVSEVALGFLLIVGAGLLIRTLVQLKKVDPGFNPVQVLSFELNLSPTDYPGDEPRRNFILECEEELSDLPGVESIGAISHLPFDDYPNWYSPYAPEGITEEEKKGLLADHRAVTPGYFQACGARLIDGRYFDRQDNAAGRKVVIVDELLAKRSWPNESAVGKRVQVEHFSDWTFVPGWAEVVGVVQHINSHDLARAGRAQIYIPYPQSARPHLSYVVRTDGDPLSLVAQIRGELNGLDNNLAVSKFRPLTEYVDKAIAPRTFTAILSSLFGGLALLLAAVGIYGVVSYSVNQRTHEIGIRMALGAQSRHVIKLVIGRGVLLTMAGVAIGMIAALMLTRLMSGLLVGVGSTDAATFAGVAALLVGVALLANYLPARRATRVDPMVALRWE
jgi:predicted permease